MGDVVGRCILGRLRSGANFLRIDEGRKKGEKPEERRCRTCWEGIEDEKHFLVECEGYERTRREYKNKIMSIENKIKEKKKKANKEEVEEKWLRIFLGQSENKEIIEKVIEYVKRITAERDRIQKEENFKRMKKREIYV